MLINKIYRSEVWKWPPCGLSRAKCGPKRLIVDKIFSAFLWGFITSIVMSYLNRWHVCCNNNKSVSCLKNIVLLCIKSFFFRVRRLVIVCSASCQRKRWKTYSPAHFVVCVIFNVQLIIFYSQWFSVLLYLDCFCISINFFNYRPCHCEEGNKDKEISGHFGVTTRNGFRGTINI